MPDCLQPCPDVNANIWPEYITVKYAICKSIRNYCIQCMLYTIESLRHQWQDSRFALFLMIENTKTLAH